MKNNKREYKLPNGMISLTILAAKVLGRFSDKNLLADPSTM